MSMKFLNGIDLVGNRASNVADPVSGTDGANKAYVDLVAAGLDMKGSVRAASTANVTITAPGATVDGVALASGDLALLKNQSTGSQNGIYVFNGAAVAMTRATNFDTSAKVTPGAFVIVEEGTANHDTVWLLTTDAPIALGTTALTFTNWQIGITYTAGNGLQLIGPTFSVLPDGTGLEVGASGVRIAAAAAGNGLVGGGASALAVGAGTGVTVTADAVSVDTSVVARKYSVTVGNGAATSIAVTHGLASSDVAVSVRDAATNVGVIVDWTATDVNTVTLVFATAPATGAYRATVIG
jgi:phage-related tail fiber protein